ncbi:FecR family protein [Caulobacter mirabilis]|uniref:FecR protein domain-containing protein n=1 Tax=Caulobacter mirabilis TaxID=69666 RepID=A0A2D2B0V9_9CAUL|nr:FecR domain-containing protein [Caulobacter mirabilis]ATQ43888.1 hypothetical protein CSW64_16530 [Caulobacter mirabilis]
MKSLMDCTSLRSEEAAVQWALRAEDAMDADEVAEMEAWLSADAQHRKAFDAALAADRLLKQFGDEDELLAMRRSALKARRERRPLPAAFAAGLVAATLLLGGVGGWWASGRGEDFARVFGGAQTTTARYVTIPGERATVSLADGSVMTLNTDSVVETTFDRRGRTAKLVQGQALFSVAHDPSRPFEVLAEGRRVTAVGTVFDVLSLPGELRVAMLDGVVRVSTDSSTPVQTLSAGEVLTAAQGGPMTVRKADTKRLAAWRDGVVFFEETPLREAVAEMNRYTRRRIVIADPRAERLRVSGAFRTSEADLFADSMAAVFGLSLRQSADGRAVLSTQRP